MGMSFIVPQADRLPQLNAVTIPEGVVDADVRKQLLEDYDLEIGAGLGDLAGKVWRVGLMGYACNKKNVLFCLGALDAVLGGMTDNINKGVAVAAAMEFYRQ
jgi:alanine-glyoxylate transaminase/serine-glyoxylate transaminase/serine-pyruvate transaminase